jgi:hypothetical protein
MQEAKAGCGFDYKRVREALQTENAKSCSITIAPNKPGKAASWRMRVKYPVKITEGEETIKECYVVSSSKASLAEALKDAFEKMHDTNQSPDGNEVVLNDLRKERLQAAIRVLAGIIGSG